MDGQHHCGRRTMAGGWLGSCASNEATKRMSLELFTSINETPVHAALSAAMH